MQFLTSLFGGSGNGIAGVIFALGLVLVLIVLSVWVLKFVFKATDHVARARGRRLALVEALPVDAKRQLLIVRRDGVEHVILTGGPQDLVLESGIPAEKPALHRPPVGATHAAQAPAPHPVEETVAAVERPPLARTTRNAVERLREFTRPLGRASTSLRHTGLMRPTSRMEVIPAYLDEAVRDSAKTTPLVEARGGDGALSRDGFKAGGN
jgi:hypothetical protein